MSKRAFTIFGTFAVILAIVIPFLAIESSGSPGAAEKSIASSDRTAQHLFQTNCGACHTVAAAGTDGVVGPNLDVLLGSTSESQSTVDGVCSRVLAAIEGGIGGRMPKGILQGGDAETVASFVARNVNYFAAASPSSATPAASSASSSGSEPEGPVTAESTHCGSQAAPTGTTNESSSSESASG